MDPDFEYKARLVALALSAFFAIFLGLKLFLILGYRILHEMGP
jgi:hypothetical protein